MPNEINWQSLEGLTPEEMDRKTEEALIKIAFVFAAFGAVTVKVKTKPEQPALPEPCIEVKSTVVEVKEKNGQ